MQSFRSFQHNLHRVALNRYIFLYLLFLSAMSFLWICTQPRLFWIAGSLFLFQFFIFFPVREYFSKVNFATRCERIKKNFIQKRLICLSTFTVAVCMGLTLVGIFGYALLVNMKILIFFFALMGGFWIFPPHLLSSEEEEALWEQM